MSFACKVIGRTLCPWPQRSDSAVGTVIGAMVKAHMTGLRTSARLAALVVMLLSMAHVSGRTIVVTPVPESVSRARADVVLEVQIESVHPLEQTGNCGSHYVANVRSRIVGESPARVEFGYFKGMQVAAIYRIYLLKNSTEHIDSISMELGASKEQAEEFRKECKAIDELKYLLFRRDAL